MKKKFIYLLALLFLVTGCDIEYNLTIDENTFDEDVKVIVPHTSQMEQIVMNSVKSRQTAFADGPTNRHYYHLDADTTDKDYIYLNYNYKYNKEDILKSSAITQCYDSVSLGNDDKYIDIVTSDIFKCMIKDSVPIIGKATINITTPLRVISNNADKVDGDTYTWKIDQNNYKEKPIKIKIKNESKTAYKSIMTLIIILGIIVLILITILIYVLIKKRQNNKL